MGSIYAFVLQLYSSRLAHQRPPHLLTIRFSIKLRQTTSRAPPTILQNLKALLCKARSTGWLVPVSMVHASPSKALSTRTKLGGSGLQGDPQKGHNRLHCFSCRSQASGACRQYLVARVSVRCGSMGNSVLSACLHCLASA